MAVSVPPPQPPQPLAQAPQPLAAAQKPLAEAAQPIGCGAGQFLLRPPRRPVYFLSRFASNRQELR
jgi:hypothetical protein